MNLQFTDNRTSRLVPGIGVEFARVRMDLDSVLI